MLPDAPWSSRAGVIAAAAERLAASGAVALEDDENPVIATWPLPAVSADDEFEPAELVAPPDRTARGRHRRPSENGQGLLASHRKRFTSFSLIGAGVFVMGLGLQFAFVRWWHLHAIPAYVLQGFISVQASFLANRLWTWRDVHAPWLRSWYRFNTQKIVTTVANTAIYVGLVHLRLNYLIAMVLTTTIFTVINYVAAAQWAFKQRSDAPDAEAADSPWSVPGAFRRAGSLHRAGYPTVSVVVPCKGNERTIRGTVDALLGQDYPALAEVILVGSIRDTTWKALADVRDPRLVILEQGPTVGRRDPNVKRHRGIEYATGTILALADSDIVMPPDWLSTGVAMLADSGLQCVAGGMVSIHDTFWGRFVDSTRMAAKTPRIGADYLVTRRNFGRWGRKPPVTANVIFTRKLYNACPLDVAWSFGYEDYEWFWRVAKAGFRVLFSHHLTGRHHHRRGLRPLCREYLQASDGCARFIRRHPDCPLARKRRRQATLLPVLAMVTAVAEVGVAGFVTSGLLIAAASVGSMALAASIWEYSEHRAVESLLYPALNLILGMLFVYGMLKRLVSGEGADARPPVPADFAAARS